MTLTTLPLSSSGQTLSYRTAGVGPPMVLLHGVGMQSAAWGPQLEHFARHNHVVALDMPGHGGSDALPLGSLLPDYVAWCDDALSSLQLGPVNLVGHSMGAMIAVGLAVTQPQHVLRVALLNGAFSRNSADKAAVQARADAILHCGIDLQTPLARWFDDAQAEPRAQVAGWLSNVDLEGYATAYNAFACGDALYADSLSNVTCPFLAMTGSDDPNSTPAMSAAMAEHVQNGRNVTIAGQRHMMNLTAANEVNRHLTDWLQRPTDRAAPKEMP